VRAARHQGPIDRGAAIGSNACGVGGFPAPLFILAPARSYSSVVTQILGCHQQLYAFPELNLFRFQTVDEWLDARDSGMVFHRSLQGGVLRAYAELRFGGLARTAARTTRLPIGGSACGRDCEIDASQGVFGGLTRRQIQVQQCSPDLHVWEQHR
jgi:hypothetical protein